MRILLVKPHPQLLIAKRLQEGFLHLEPLELEIVAGGVPDEDEASICDLGIEEKPLEIFHDRLHKINPRIIGFTGYSSQSAMVKKLARLVKEQNPSIVTVAGGVHATIMPADYAEGSIDIIVRGEGGTTFREIVNRYKQGLPLHFGNVSLSPDDPEFREKSEMPPPEFPPVQDMPRPRRDLVQRSRYFCVWTSAPADNRRQHLFC
ncbi:MAG: cobalamin B12-binding domain-containing protein [Nitrospirae bacterium]|nr:cobalamin B12-binding domain-containing protein [Nitrospirota bacterium]